jgi:hypothetical protein
LKFLVIDGCPCPRSIAPYVYLVLREAGQSASSIYRGADADRILHAHGKHDQAEIHAMYPSISNPPGRSEHELRSDGFANAGPVGRRLKEWEIGVDSGTDDQASRDRVSRAAQHYGWQIRHPYTRGVEGHHWCFSRRPRPRSLRQFRQIVRLRKTLPTR